MQINEPATPIELYRSHSAYTKMNGTDLGNCLAFSVSGPSVIIISLFLYELVYKF